MTVLGVSYQDIENRNVIWTLLILPAIIGKGICDQNILKKVRAISYKCNLVYFIINKILNILSYDPLKVLDSPK